MIDVSETPRPKTELGRLTTRGRSTDDGSWTTLLVVHETEIANAGSDFETCPVCRSGEAIRQTSCTSRVEAWACDRCDSRWAMTVVNPRPFLGDIATAVAVRSIADEVITLAQDPRQ